MAYKNLIAQSCNNPIETFLRCRDFLCSRVGTYDYSTTGIGWTLHDMYYLLGGSSHYYDTTSQDTISINDYFVVKSVGEDGLRQLYFKFTYVSGAINVDGYLYWDNSSHTGYKRYYSSSASWTNTLATNNILWVYGDLDKVQLISKYSTTHYPCEIGWCPDSSLSTAVTAHAGSISAGSSVAVTFTSVPA